MDGYVSFEVSPYLAHDTEGTMQEVRRLWHAVNCSNLFIKIPGTSAGVPAIEEMLYKGININITLLFSVRACEARVAESQPVDHVASVASFFLCSPRLP
jgi:transaldolase